MVRRLIAVSDVRLQLSGPEVSCVRRHLHYVHTLELGYELTVWRTLSAKTEVPESKLFNACYLHATIRYRQISKRARDEISDYSSSHHAPEMERSKA